ncbi:hypothetical protein CI109_104885 [Kwoniella shandongensis]|uniref:Uncharacterized protein n=1 Tax=Kwoniella shandongensis TaxID=1734106 RepID=A0A5M6BQM8_9TREE|nr:uncharacterized protein CI109_006604 [Kwoniella shandongensis]KAA5525053.1 hypothetical protein CI109_006604 [Kwoniella shandongensis]
MDARSLLRAKKAEARISHPYAAYNAAGVLRCSICAVPVKQWDAHLLTKQHRTSVAREKAEQEKARSKRAAEDSAGGGGKRARTAQTAVPQEEEEEEDGPAGLPAGFFSSGNRPTVAVTSDEPGPSSAPAPSVAAAAAPVPAQTGDAELDDFLSSLNSDVDTPSTSTIAVPPTAASKRKIATYKEVIPGQASYEAAPVRIIPAEENPDGQGGGAEAETEPEETEAERRARLEREEREDIVARLEEEERAQEDADSRVTMLKQRMEMLKKRREAKGVKGKSAAS